ncbi:MAG: DNA primase DnaG [Nanoarchaeota archaeon]
MAKISPVSIKYMIKARFVAEGALEKPDVIGALFGQTEGLLGADLEMRDLQKEGKIGRIEVELEHKNGKTLGLIEIPTALDQSETTLIAAAIETIERVGPTDAKIEIEKIEDVRGKKRDYIIERAKLLLGNLQSGAISKEISESIKVSAREARIQEYGDEKLPAGDISGNEIIVVEGRADVLNLLRNGVNNVIGMNGTKLPAAISQLGKEKEITLFIDGDRGGKLIAKNVTENANITYIAVAPDGKEVEELSGKEILMSLRKKVPLSSFFNEERTFSSNSKYSASQEREYNHEKEQHKLTDENKIILKNMAKEISGSKKALLLNENLEIVKEISEKSLTGTLRRSYDKKIFAVILDGIATNTVINTCEDSGIKVLMAKNFTSTTESIIMLSF